MARKGGDFEREFCTLLSSWWTGGEDTSCFWRTAMSGGRATVRRRKGLNTRGHAGDICATDDCGLPLTRAITFELKRGYNQVTIHADLDRKKAPAADTPSYGGWFAQARAAADRAGSPYWAVVHRRDGRLPIIFFPYEMASRTKILDPKPSPFVLVKNTLSDGAVATAAGMLLGEWFLRFTPADFKKGGVLCRSRS